MTEELAEVVAEEEVELAHNLPAVREHEAMVTRGEVTADEVVQQRDKIKQVMAAVMRDEVHYGTIPGVNKPTLLKPGAEVLAVTLRLAPHYHSERTFHDDGHLTVVSKVTLVHIPSGLTIAEGEGLCTSREKKYAKRKSERVCPACGAAAIIKGKAEYGGGWLCWKKRDGCGAKFPDGDEAIESQPDADIDNPDLPDTFNTVLKMANKRAFIAAILNGTAASDIFTQDMEDAAPQETAPTPPKAAAPAGAGDPNNLTPETITVHFGKNAGALLSSLSERAIGWYADEWKNGDTEYDIALKRAAVTLKYGADKVPDDLASLPF